MNTQNKRRDYRKENLNTKDPDKNNKYEKKTIDKIADDSYILREYADYYNKFNEVFKK